MAGWASSIKILPEGHESPDRRRRFLQEAQAASSLNHPNIVTIHDVDSVNGVDFIVMEYVDGRPLIRLIRAGGLPLDRVLDYQTQAFWTELERFSPAVPKPSGV